MSKSKNICPVCGGHKSVSTTTFTVDFGFGVVVIRHVPAQICEQYSEEWTDDKTAESLEVFINEAKNKRSMVEVTEYIPSNTTKKAS